MTKSMTDITVHRELVIDARSLVIARTLVNLNPIDITCRLVYSRQALLNATLIPPASLLARKPTRFEPFAVPGRPTTPQKNLTHESYCPLAEQNRHEVSRHKFKAFAIV